MEKFNAIFKEQSKSFKITIDHFAEEAEGGYNSVGACCKESGTLKKTDGSEINVERNEILIKKQFIANPLFPYTEDRLIVVLFHEIGHAKFNNLPEPAIKINMFNNTADEVYAINHSIEECISLFKNGDRLPLKEVLFWITRRKFDYNDYHDSITHIMRGETWKTAWKLFPNN